MTKVILTAVIAVGLVSGAFAQVTPQVDMGTKEIQGSGSLVGDTPSGDAFALRLGYGYFVRDQLQVSVVGGIEDDDISTAWQLGVATQYNVLPYGWGPWVPYVGAALLAVGTDFSQGDSQTTAGLRFSGGMKYFLHDHVALGLQAAWDYAFDDVFMDEGGNLNDNQWKLLFGIHVYYD